MKKRNSFVTSWNRILHKYPPKSVSILYILGQIPPTKIVVTFQIPLEASQTPSLLGGHRSSHLCSQTCCAGFLPSSNRTKFMVCLHVVRSLSFRIWRCGSNLYSPLTDSTGGVIKLLRLPMTSPAKMGLIVLTWPGWHLAIKERMSFVLRL